MKNEHPDLHCGEAPICEHPEIDEITNLYGQPPFPRCLAWPTNSIEQRLEQAARMRRRVVIFTILIQVALILASLALFWFLAPAF